MTQPTTMPPTPPLQVMGNPAPARRRRRDRTASPAPRGLIETERMLALMQVASCARDVLVTAFCSNTRYTEPELDALTALLEALQDVPPIADA